MTSKLNELIDSGIKAQQSGRREQALRCYQAAFELAPGIVRHCGIDWEPQCLKFQSQKRAVATLSAVQIREPVQLRKGVAENYRQFLEPLRERLELAGVDLN